MILLSSRINGNQCRSGSAIREQLGTVSGPVEKVEIYPPQARLLRRPDLIGTPRNDVLRFVHNKTIGRIAQAKPADNAQKQLFPC